MKYGFNLKKLKSLNKSYTTWWSAKKLIYFLLTNVKSYKLKFEFLYILMLV